MRNMDPGSKTAKNTLVYITYRTRFNDCLVSTPAPGRLTTIEPRFGNILNLARLSCIGSRSGWAALAPFPPFDLSTECRLCLRPRRPHMGFAGSRMTARLPDRQDRATLCDPGIRAVPARSSVVPWTTCPPPRPQLVGRWVCRVPSHEHSWRAWNVRRCGATGLHADHDIDLAPTSSTLGSGLKLLLPPEHSRGVV